MHPALLDQLARLRSREALTVADRYRVRLAVGLPGRRPTSRGTQGFLRLWGSAGSSNLADGVLFAGLPVLATQVTDSPALIAGVAVALMLPMASAALPAGLIADRFDGRRILVLANVVRVVGLVAVLGAALAGELTIAAIYAAATITGGSEVLVDTTAQTAVPGLVPEAGLVAANAKLGGTQVVMNDAIGAPIGGFLAGIGIGLTFGVPALLFGLAAWLPRRLHLRPTSDWPRTGPLTSELRHDLREGVRYLAAHTVLRRIALVNGVTNLGNTAFFAVFVLFVTGPLDLPATAYGGFLAAVAVGGTAGSLAAAPLLRALGYATTVRCAMVINVGVFVAATLTQSWQVMALCAATLGASSLVWNIGTRALRQTVVPDLLLGRVTATMTLVALSATPLGALLGGVVAEVTGVRAAGGVAITANLWALALLAPVTTAAVSAARERSAKPGCGHAVSSASEDGTRIAEPGVCPPPAEHVHHREDCTSARTRVDGTAAELRVPTLRPPPNTPQERTAVQPSSSRTSPFSCQNVQR